ncbi:NRDE family protein [Bacillus sp. ISL-47]|uniref:NRDE family protein n=1 Tax=Bacillus sp. ISL-47 TaxID=2819130 RepID=UPI001BE5D0BB|nr:NRDE family protein [Bacillus sp. ISL-47]MBT2689109.1 NRDE family protein [Bacillus sp. ISL-47]MBT2708565.1 NRDE family protein [Pseudomonas sp. ISL-84]
MCLILFAYKVHPKYKLVVAANRDEFYERPTAPAHFWEDHPNILAGRDLKKMGTWMGVAKDGRFAALTNYRDPNEVTDGKRSRGELVAGFLKGNGKPEEFMKKAAGNREQYPSYNLLAGNADELYYYSNVENKMEKLEPGIYGVSNHVLNTEWPKVKRGKEGLAERMETSDNSLTEELFTLLQHADPAPDEFLPKTGVSLEWERILSPMFIKSEGYGTRSSTVMLMSDAEIFYKERVYAGGSQEEQEFTIQY